MEAEEPTEHRPVVRAARPADLPRLVELVHEHAAYEKSAPRLWVLPAEAPDGSVAGYAACSAEFAVWDARRHLHMDCLHLAEEARGQGLGAALMEGVADLARKLDLDRVQWQTPDWNEGAIRFYHRLGAAGAPKRRHTLPVPPRPGKAAADATH
ncbi:GNAT family N-acetyltransferase [Streptomyces sp. NPDC051704]|uniref:GNAT family N-acetyltransferase n=1 Tax=Streptomyces sp. NPDC051704 TaxID=3365671 RepID=UPI0037AB9A0A